MPHRPKPCKHLPPPPGLSDTCTLTGKSLGTDVISLARRVQRLELLLFQTPDVDFKRVDQHILSVLSSEDLNIKPGSHDVSAWPICEMYDISEHCGDPLNEAEAATCQATGKAIVENKDITVENAATCEADQNNMPSSGIMDNTCAKSLDELKDYGSNMREKLMKLEADLALLSGHSYVERAALPAIFIADILPSVTMVMNQKFDTFDARVHTLEVTVPRLHEQMEKTMQMVDRLANTSLASLGQPTKPKTRSRK